MLQTLYVAVLCGDDRLDINEPKEKRSGLRDEPISVDNAEIRIFQVLSFFLRLTRYNVSEEYVQQGGTEHDA